MSRKKSVPEQIEDLLTVHWECGYKCGAEWQKEADREVLEEEKGYAYDKGSEEGYNAGLKEQKEEDNAVLERATIDAYIDGNDKGYDKGYTAGLKGRGGERMK